MCFVIFFLKKSLGGCCFLWCGYLYARLFICGYLCARLFICKCFCFYNGDNNSPCRLEIIEIMLPAAQEGVWALNKWGVSANPLQIQSHSKCKGKLQNSLSEMGSTYSFVSHRYYDKKYQVFLKLVEHQKEYAAIMKGDWAELAGVGARRSWGTSPGTSVPLTSIQDPLGIISSSLCCLSIKKTKTCATGTRGFHFTVPPLFAW